MQEENPLSFPKAKDRERLYAYAHYDKLYAGDHYDAFAIKAEKDFTERYSRLRYIAANFAGLISRVMADMMFGENIVIDLKQNQVFVDNLKEENQLITQLYESELANSRRGDSLFKMRVGPRNKNVIGQESTIIIEEISPAIYFPEISENSTRYTPDEDVLAWTFQQNNNTYLHKEIHTPGFIRHEIYRYDPKDEKIISEENVEEFGFKKLEETKVNRSLVFHIPNVRDGSGFFGASDYKDLLSLFFAINNRITKIDNILDKHSDPILAVPPGVLDEDGKIKKEALGMFEVDNETPGFNKPEYIVWNANLDAAENEVEKLIELLFILSEISPATVGENDKSGLAESGRALKFKLIATIRKRNRKIRYYDQAIKDMLVTAQELAVAHSIKVGGESPALVNGKGERPTIDWGDGVINDQTEIIENEVKRVDAGLSSKADSIARIDGMTPDEAKKKVKEIEAESEPKLPMLDKNGQPLPQPNTVKNQKTPQPATAGI